MLFDLIGRLNRPFLSFADGAGGGDGGGDGGGGGGGGGGGKDGDGGGGGGGGGDDAMKALVKKHEAELESVKNHRDLTIVEKRDMKAKLDELKTSFDKLGGPSVAFARSSRNVPKRVSRNCNQTLPE